MIPAASLALIAVTIGLIRHYQNRVDQAERDSRNTTSELEALKGLLDREGIQYSISYVYYDDLLAAKGPDDIRWGEK